MVKKYIVWLILLPIDMHIEYHKIWNPERVNERLDDKPLKRNTQITFREFVAVSFDYDTIENYPAWYQLFIKNPSTIEEAEKIYKEYKTKETRKIELKW